VSVAELLLGDSRFPAGGHAHSGGVEPAVTAGTVAGLDSLELFLRGRLRTSGLVAAAIAAVACGAQAPGDAAGFWTELDAEADARTPSPAQREASRRQGRALLRAARVAWPDAPGLAELAALAALAGGRGTRTASGPAGRNAEAGGPSAASAVSGPGAAGGPRAAHGTGARGDAVTEATAVARRREYRGGAHHAVVLGAAAAAAGCEPREAARIAAYQAAAGPVSAAVRLLALDPMRATGVLARLTGDIDQIAEQGAGYAGQPPADLPCPSAPALDLLAEAHIQAEVRLFES
jgi:urease accessory protein